MPRYSTQTRTVQSCQKQKLRLYAGHLSACTHSATMPRPLYHPSHPIATRAHHSGTRQHSTHINSDTLSVIPNPYLNIPCFDHNDTAAAFFIHRSQASRLHSVIASPQGSIAGTGSGSLRRPPVVPSPDPSPCASTHPTPGICSQN